MITVATLIAAGISPTMARTFAEPLAAACAKYEINTPMREAAFVAQCAHESGGFAHLEESLWYRNPESIRANWPTRVPTLAAAKTLVGNPKLLANTVYSNRGGNGSPGSNDGWKYIGRGLIQLTLRDNYRHCSHDTGQPYEAQPELLALPAGACTSAAWYWNDRHINALADTGDVVAVTRAINPSLLGIDDRRTRYAAAMEAFA